MKNYKIGKKYYGLTPDRGFTTEKAELLLKHKRTGGYYLLDFGLYEEIFSTKKELLKRISETIK